MAIPLLNCTKLFKFRCPKTWSSLEGKQGDTVRFCKSCKKNVYLCQTPEEIYSRAQIGSCIAIVAKERIDGPVADYMGEPSEEDCGALVSLVEIEDFTIDDERPEKKD